MFKLFITLFVALFLINTAVANKEMNKISSGVILTDKEENKYFPMERLRPSTQIYNQAKFCASYVNNHVCECCNLVSGTVTNTFIFSTTSLYEYFSKDLQGKNLPSDKIKDNIAQHFHLYCGAVCTGDKNVIFLSQDNNKTAIYMCFLSGDVFSTRPVCGLVPPDKRDKITY